MKHLRPLHLGALLLLTGCGGSEPGHPWLDLGEGSPHRIVDFAGVDAGQIVIAMDPTVSPDEAMELGRRVQAQAPPGATVNARLYDDETTARNWSTAPAQMRIEHLQVVVSINPDTGLDEVRWVRPDSLDASGPAVGADTGADTADSLARPTNEGTANPAGTADTPPPDDGL